jgi:DNA ligase D-like protein (predicted 3'-phosphoesterase)
MKHTITHYFFLAGLCLSIGGQSMAAPKKLSTYRKKREFKETPEPRGRVKKTKSKEPMYVIQLHDASHLHYDFRLEIDGVLVSWAVPKGPHTDPSVKRLAIQTEDHPMEYGDFEGIIPQGNYGGGTVMVWDTGTFENIKTHKGQPVSLTDSYKRGTLEFILHGKKLKGAYALIKPHGGAFQSPKNWLLIKIDDKYANKKITNKTKSALSGRTLKQIAADADSVWE